MASSTLFDISNQSLKLTTIEDLEPHIKPLLSSNTVTEINLNGNTFGVSASVHLSSILSKQKQLERVNFSDIFTSRLLSEIPPALRALLTALLECPRLHTVDLSDNAFGLNTVEPLVEFLKAHTPLQHLILNNNGMGPIAGAQIAEALEELAGKKAAARKEGKEVADLETIVCGRNRLENGSMKAWAKAYTALGKVKSIRMTQNGIRPEGIVILLRDGLKNCPRLETVDLQDNTFTINGATALANIVGGWAGLRELGLSDCYLKSRGVVKVVDTLAKGGNKHLQTVRLQYNDLDAEGLKSVVDAVKGGGLPAVKRMEFNGNKFSEDDTLVEQLRELLEEKKVAAGGDDSGEGEWGLDELDEMEDDSEEEEGEDEDEDEQEEQETEEQAERILKDADQEENQKVAQRQDDDVDDLANALGKKLGV